MTRSSGVASGGWRRTVIGPLGLVVLLAGCESSSTGASHGDAVKTVRDDPRISPRMAYMASADAHATGPGDPSPFRFAEVRQESGIDFVHFSGTTSERLFPTAFGSGVAMLDYDGDGRLDLYFATGTLLPAGRARTGSNTLYRNLGNGRFRDATKASGLGYAGFCHGIIAGDVDNDGDTDVFLCNCGNNVLYLNGGDGTFTDISRSAGIDRPGWSSGGAMLDYDNDGDLDIFVANYGAWEYLRNAHRCGSEEIPLYCSPGAVPTTRHILYRNNGDRSFTDVTDRAGVGRSDGRGFGVVAADLNGDGRVDLYVANDLRPNFVFLNRGDGTFEDATESSGAAFDAQGVAQSSMGVDAEDCDGDGRPELFVTNFQYEYSAYYQNLPPTAAGPETVAPVLFRDVSASVGLVADSKPYVGWGCALADFDNDGWPDCFVTNGHLDSNRQKLGPTLTYLEPPMLHRNVPTGVVGGTDAASAAGRQFRRATRDAGPYFDARHAGRGAAFGDIDDDGDIDIVINHRDAAPAILRNDTPGGNRWIRLELVGTRSNRDAIGALVTVLAGGRTITRQRKGGGSMQSTNDPRLLIGLGPVDEVTRLTIRWPSGRISTLEHLAIDTGYRIMEPRDAHCEADVIPLP